MGERHNWIRLQSKVLASKLNCVSGPRLLGLISTCAGSIKGLLELERFRLWLRLYASIEGSFHLFRFFRLISAGKWLSFTLDFAGFSITIFICRSSWFLGWFLLFGFDWCFLLFNGTCRGQFSMIYGDIGFRFIIFLVSDVSEEIRIDSRIKGQPLVWFVKLLALA